MMMAWNLVSWTQAWMSGRASFYVTWAVIGALEGSFIPGTILFATMTRSEEIQKRTMREPDDADFRLWIMMPDAAVLVRPDPITALETVHRSCNHGNIFKLSLCLVNLDMLFLRRRDAVREHRQNASCM